MSATTKLEEKAPVVFSVSDVSFTFPGEDTARPLFQRLNLDIFKGESFAILGPSGAGKTVFLKMLVGLMAPNSGSILFQGANLSRLSKSQRSLFLRRVGMTFQRGGLFDSLTVGENLRFPLRELTQFSTEEIEKQVHKSLADVGLEGQQDLMVHEMSGGMQKRLGIARALLLSPEVILYDDPTAGLDPVTSRSIQELIRQVKEKYKMTVVIVTSDPHQIYDMADRIGFLYEKNFLEVGPTEEVRNSQNKIVEQFIKGLLQGPLTKRDQKRDRI